MYSNMYPNSNHEDRKEDTPPFSRVFLVCSKSLREDDLRKPFSRYGDIEDLYMPRDRNTGDNKGIAYIKYNKTSSAAAAIEDMHMKHIGNESKPIKVMIASTNRHNQESNLENKHKRLFIKVSKDTTETDIKNDFSEFGHVKSVMIQKDKVTFENRGFAYVNFNSFFETAKAFEECDKKYKPVFATPRDTLKRSSHDLDTYQGSSQMNMTRDNYHDYDQEVMHKRLPHPFTSSKPQGYTTVDISCSPIVSQEHIERLFSIIPGLNKCQYTTDSYNGMCKATITYDTEESAAHAVNKLNNFEYPSGEIITVKPVNPLSKVANELTDIVNNFKNALDSGSPNLMILANAIATASSLFKSVASGTNADKDFCNVPLPPQQNMAAAKAAVVKRCFIVCKPHPPPSSVLVDVFNRFGDLIDVMTFPNKTFGFAKYASAESALTAIKTLNGAIVCGSKLKVLEADEKLSKDEQNMDLVDSNVENNENKRLKLEP